MIISKQAINPLSWILIDAFRKREGMSTFPFQMIAQKLPRVVVDDLLEFDFQIIDHRIDIGGFRIQTKLFKFIDPVGIHFRPVRSVRTGCRYGTES